VANGWLQRAKRLLGEQPEAPERGMLLEREAEVANGSGALELALKKAGRAVEVGGACGMPTSPTRKKDAALVVDTEPGWVRTRKSCDQPAGLPVPAALPFENVG
jgi:hypothetical protein